MRGMRRADPCWGFQRVLHNAVRGLGRRQTGDHIQAQVRQAARAGRRARQEDRVLRGYQGNGARLALVQADLREGAWRRGVRDA